MLATKKNLAGWAAHRTERQSWPSTGASTAQSLSTSVFSDSAGKGTLRRGGALSRRDNTACGTSSARERCGSTSWNLAGSSCDDSGAQKWDVYESLISAKEWHVQMAR